MRTQELLEQCKLKLKIQKECELARALKIRRQRINDYLKGNRLPTNYALMRIADCLNIDGFTLICEFETLRAMNREERDYWSWLHSCCREQEKIQAGSSLYRYLCRKKSGQF